jgi:hypothetical protein
MSNKQLKLGRSSAKYCGSTDNSFGVLPYDTIIAIGPYHVNGEGENPFCKGENRVALLERD